MNIPENPNQSIFTIWSKANVYNIEKNSSKPKWFQIFAYPAPSGFFHVGTLRSYTYPDVIAKFKRFTGYNVYFPAGIHASGLPAVQFSEKVRSGMYDNYLKANNCTPDIIEQFQTATGTVHFFQKNYPKIWKQMGFFINEESGTPTTIDIGYQKFIQWQFRYLAKQGFVIQKEYISSYCPKDGPVQVDTAETDLSSGGTAQIFEFTVIAFQIVGAITIKGSKYSEIAIIPATMRPETIFGVTNIWIRPNTHYSIIQFTDKYYIVAESSISNIRTIFTDFTIKGSISSNDLINKMVINPITDDTIPIIPSTIVQDGIGTGVVMSVPAHSPIDFLGYNESIKNGFKIANPKVVIKSIFDGIPSEEVIQKYSIKNISNTDQIESANSYIINKEVNNGIIICDSSDYTNMKVDMVREKIKKQIVKKRIGFKGLFFNEVVICRCGAKVQIRYVPDQWFIRYSDKTMKNQVKQHISTSMNMYPKSIHEQMPSIIDWFEDRPCVRTGVWLGTPFPQEITEQKQSNFIIEPIADSTIYPSYYTISKYIENGSIDPAKLEDDFFDFVFSNKGNIHEVTQKTTIKESVIQEIQEFFQTWYPVDCNFGGKEHITVHFPVFMQMHAMMYPKKYWPRIIFINWWVMQNINEKQKVAKSKGGAGPIAQAIEKYSADAIRLYYCHSASPQVDIEWSESKISMYKHEIEKIKAMINHIYENSISSSFPKDLETWFDYNINSIFRDMYESMKTFQIRKMAQDCYYTIPNLIKQYYMRGCIITENQKPLIRTWITYLSLISPFMAEQIYQRCGYHGSVFLVDNIISKPQINSEPSIIEEEDFIQNLITDIMKLKIIVKKVRTDRVFVFTNGKVFSSQKSEEEVINSANSYLFKKTGTNIFVNLNIEFKDRIISPQPRKPVLIFK